MSVAIALASVAVAGGNGRAHGRAALPSRWTFFRFFVGGGAIAVVVNLLHRSC